VPWLLVLAACGGELGPDGRCIAFTVGDFGSDRWAAMAVDVAGGPPREIVDDMDSGNVAWSPDGSRLYFGRHTARGDGGGDNSALHVIELATGVVRRIGTE
jgi:Tol biopolymer transport system component